ncbi:MAG TPA: terminase family protein, partial [Candidatus Kapabacteria bacterium]|nr:terminase family protein [Candidatus Kapabacteria bacterium]
MKHKKKLEGMSPSEFAHSRLGLTSWKKFDAIFEAVEAGHRRILIRSANGVGKTTALAALCNWKLFTSKECIVLTTSSNEKQLRHNLWGEIRKQAIAAKLYEPKQITDTRIKLDEKRYMLAVSPAKPESAQGFHAASMLIAVDEATAVRRDILSSLIATANSDDVQIVMIYNPITPDSFVYEAERSGQWKVITISALEHPNVAKKKTKINGAVTFSATEHNLKLWSEEAEPNDAEAFELHGKWWRKTLEACRRILGQWYEDHGQGIISRALINAAIANQHAASGAKTMGIDLAGGGKDETVIARFDGGIQLPFIVMRTNKILDIVAKIEEQYHNGFTRIAI